MHGIVKPLYTCTIVTRKTRARTAGLARKHSTYRGELEGIRIATMTGTGIRRRLRWPDIARIKCGGRDLPIWRINMLHCLKAPDPVLIAVIVEYLKIVKIERKENINWEGAQ